MLLILIYFLHEFQIAWGFVSGVIGTAISSPNLKMREKSCTEGLLMCRWLDADVQAHLLKHCVYISSRFLWWFCSEARFKSKFFWTFLTIVKVYVWNIL